MILQPWSRLEIEKIFCTHFMFVLVPNSFLKKIDQALPLVSPNICVHQTKLITKMKEKNIGILNATTNSDFVGLQSAPFLGKLNMLDPKIFEVHMTTRMKNHTIQDSLNVATKFILLLMEVFFHRQLQ